jgi:deferrochelatase/peroxidase EfeB
MRTIHLAVNTRRSSTKEQSGILSRAPEHLLLAALAFPGDGAAGNRETLGLLQSLVERELSSNLDDMDAASPKDQPPAETGELGFHDHYDRANLTVTLGIAAGGFEALGVAVEQRPADLIEIPLDQLGDNPRRNAKADTYCCKSAATTLT